MLKNEIKRKVDILRDLLAGLLPDPFAQIEQIMVALIYRAIDDMGETGFLSHEQKAEDLNIPSFKHLMQMRCRPSERLRYYEIGLETIGTFIGLPEAVCNILKGASIPERDPDAIERFLWAVSEFTFDDVACLGDIFEYLLSMSGGKTDAIQFLTPRHIINMMVKIVDPRIGERVLDPTCSTANFLIAARDAMKRASCVEMPNHVLNMLVGYDASPDMVRLGRINMLLHGFPTPNINEYNVLTQTQRWNERYDVILSNPPFMTIRSSIEAHLNFHIRSKRAEVHFVEYIIEHLTEDGRAAVIVPEGIVFQNQNAFQHLRWELIHENFLYAVISLPSGVFNPYTNVKTSILLMDRRLARECKDILFVKLKNDGFDLSVQRREREGNEIPEIVNLVKRYQAGETIEERENVLKVSKEIVAKHQYVLAFDEYAKSNIPASKWPMIALSECCEMRVGGTPSKQNPEFWQNGTIKWISSKHISDNGTIRNYELITKEALQLSSTKIAPRGSTILMTRVSVGKFAYADDDYAINQDMTCLIPDNRVDPEYLFLIAPKLAAQIARDSHGTSILGVTQKYVADMHIPLPPISEQKRLIADVSKYQKSQHEAQKVVDNCKRLIQSRISEVWGE